MCCEYERSILVFSPYSGKEKNSYGFSYFYLKAFMIIGCQVVRLPDLPFNFRYGSCNTFKQSEEKALMCFGNTNNYYDTNAKECFM